MKITYKSPQPELKIYNYDEPDPCIIFSANEMGKKELLSYSFSESVKDLQGTFKFSIAGGNNNFFNEIKPLQIVEIYEGEEKPVFTGIIKSRNVSCSMTDSGVQRAIHFQGKSITSLIAEFQLIMDVKFLKTLDIQDATSRNQNLKIRLNKLERNGLTVKEFLKTTWEAYLEYTGIGKEPTSGKKAAGNIAVYNIIAQFLGESFFELADDTTEIAMPIANSFLNQEINTVLQIWQCILAPPIYEIFSRVNKTGKTKVVVREAPFDSKAWSTLTCKRINSWDLIDYSVKLSDEEVYTAFLGYLEGSALSADQYVIISETDANKRNDSILRKDDKKFELYGLKLCQVAFRGYKKDSFTEDQTVKAMKDLGERLKAWFGRLDEMYTGSATIINHFDGKAVRAGEKVGFLGGEFYVQNVQHEWKYGGRASITLSLIRGGIYEEGQFIKTIPDIGKSGIEFEHDENSI